MKRIINYYLTSLKRKDRTVKQAGFLVLRNTYMPSVLVETGFLTNKREGAYLNSSKGQQEIAVSIAKAILNYKDRLYQTNSSDENKILKNSEQIVTPNQPASDIMFKIQIAASKKNIDLKPYNFKGLTSLTKQKSGAVYRYFYQQSANYEQAQKDLKVAKSKGFKSSFIVAFNGDKKITISEALRLLK